MIHAHWSAPYLMEPAQNRIAEYQRLRESVRQGIGQLEALIKGQQFQEVRTLFAQLRTHEITHSESDRILALRDMIPEAEQPIYDPQYSRGKQYRRNYWVETIDNGYGILIESMTRKEFKEFVRKVGTGELVTRNRECDPTYVFGIMENTHYRDDEQFSVMAETIDRRLIRLEQAPDEPTDAWWSEYWMLERSMFKLSYLSMPETTKKILGVIRYGMDHKYYGTNSRRADPIKDVPNRFSDLVSYGMGFLDHSVRAHPENRSVINLAELISWQTELQKYSDNVGTRFILDNLQKVIELVVASPETPPRTTH